MQAAVTFDFTAYRDAIILLFYFQGYQDYDRMLHFILIKVPLLFFRQTH